MNQEVKQKPYRLDKNTLYAGYKLRFLMSAKIKDIKKRSMHLTTQNNLLQRKKYYIKIKREVKKWYIM